MVTRKPFKTFDNNTLQLQKGSLYLHKANTSEYHCISPFIIITEDGHKFYFFSKMDEPLLGKIQYSGLNSSDELFRECPEFIYKGNLINGESTRIVSLNKTIYILFKDNYTNYIDQNNSIRDEIKTFLDNKADVAATVWGHGGVGKTAMIQYLCNLFIHKDKKFDYIIFTSAKNREYTVQPTEGGILKYTSQVGSLDDILCYCNLIINGIFDSVKGWI